jgi:hypothetical protein
MKTNKLYQLLLLLLIYSCESTYCQPDSTRKNIISIAPLSLIDQTISFSFTRKINGYIDISFNPRIRIQDANNIDSRVISKGWIWYRFDDPYYYYNKFAFRLGLTFHRKHFFFEPNFQYENAFFKNQKIYITDPHPTIEYEILNRSFRSYGIIALFGVIIET